jgi:hypothetical protein
MSFKQYVILMGIGTLAAISAWLVVLFLIDPASSGAIPKIAFFVTLFAALVGFLTTIGTVLRVLVIHKTELVSREVHRAFRQALFFSLIILAALTMAVFDYLRWWSIGLVILFFAFLEAFVQTSRPRDL